MIQNIVIIENIAVVTGGLTADLKEQIAERAEYAANAADSEAVFGCCQLSEMSS